MSICDKCDEATPVYIITSSQEVFCMHCYQEVTAEKRLLIESLPDADEYNGGNYLNEMMADYFAYIIEGQSHGLCTFADISKHENH